MNKVLKVLTAVALTEVLAYVMVLRSPQIRQNVAVRDSIAYWAAGRLAIHRQNPYDRATVFRLEQEHGYKDPRPLILRTPPWSLFVVSPLGFLNPFLAWVAWIGLSLSCLLIGMRLCAKMYGQGMPPNLFTVLGYTFAPVPACLVSGQMGLVLMLGFVLFLWWEPKRPLLAGAALVLPFAKPHLLSLFWIVFIIWIVLRRKREAALGFLAALTFATAIALVLDPRVFQHYRDMLHTASIGNEFIPALSGALRLLFFRRMFWMQFVPLLAGLIWAVRFFSRNAFSWDWRQHGPALLVVSVLTTPYEWLSDETVLLPAILQAAAFAYAARASMKVRTKIALVVFALLDILLLLILKSKVPFSTGIYFWSSLVWFFWYFSAHKWYSRASSSPVEIEVAALNSKAGR
jgi:Glycosyltransferase family 87